MKFKRIKIPRRIFSAREQRHIAPRKGLTKYALESRLVSFTEGVLNAVIGLRIFISKHQQVGGSRECETPLLSSRNYKWFCDSE